MREILCSTGLTPEQAEMGVLCHYRLFKEGRASLVTDTVKNLLGREPVSLEEFFRDAAIKPLDFDILNPHLTKEQLAKVAANRQKAHDIQMRKRMQQAMGSTTVRL